MNKWYFRWRAWAVYAIILIFLVGSFDLKESTDNPPELQPKPQTHAIIPAVAPALITEDNLYQVVKVVDGDTITVEKGGVNQTLRLIGINTPETVDPRKPVECFGQEASAKAKELLSGKQVRLEADPTQGELDKYQRTLRYIFLPDGTNFNRLMIEQGYAYEYTYDLPYKYQTEFKQAEKEAKAAKRGLWADNVCIEQSSVVPTTAPDGKYVCSQNTYNCSDFTTQAEAQAAFESCGGVDNDIHQLDRDKDGVVCESLK